MPQSSLFVTSRHRLVAFARPFHILFSRNPRENQSRDSGVSCRGYSTASATNKNGPALPREETDVLIIGSGAGALTAALRAKVNGLRVIVVEKETTLGGASAISGGGIWIPCNPVSMAAGIEDSKENALKYFEQAVGDVGPASSLARRHAYIDNGPKMVAFLQKLGFRFHFSKGYPDYYPKMYGAMGERGGRTIETRTFNTKKIGKWQRFLPPTRAPLAIYTNDAPVLTQLTSSVQAFVHSMKVAVPLMLKMLFGQRLTSMGHGLVAQLLHLNLQRGIDLRLETTLEDVLTGPNGEIIGARVKSKEETQIIATSQGIILAAGGFARNKIMHEKYHPTPTSIEWTSSPKGDMGDAIRAGVKVGAATAIMDDAWWGPTIIDPVTSSPSFALFERSRPHCIIVDADGCRFMNEAQSYTDAGHDQYKRNETVKAIPAWLIMDKNHRDRYMIGTQLFARMEPKSALNKGLMFKSDNLEDLACQIGVNPSGLRDTVQRYNKMCKTGVDADFGKGDNVYDNFFGDPKQKPNPNLGSLEKAPFYAIQIWPGDLGTKGGLLTDEFQRVLKEDGKVILGLYAIGNTAASIMGRTYLGAGSTLGPAMTHGFIAANHLAYNDIKR